MVSNLKSGTLYVRVTVSDPGLVSVGGVEITGTTTGVASVWVPSPALLGTGSYKGTFTIEACLNDATCRSGQLRGSPATFTVTYNVGSPVQLDTVMPGMVESGHGGQAILRSNGLSNVSSVSIGDQSATSLRIVDDSEIHFGYPALSPGVYPVAVRRGEASSPLQAQMVVFEPATYPHAHVDMQAPPGYLYEPRKILYDARTRSMIVAVRVAYFVNGVKTYQDRDTVLQRYTFADGVWSFTADRIWNDFSDMEFTPGHDTLLASVQDTVVHMDPVTLDWLPIDGARGASGELAVLNDGSVLSANGHPQIPTLMTMYSLATHLVSTPWITDGGEAKRLTRASIGVSGDGSMVLAQEDVESGYLTRYFPTRGTWETLTAATFGRPLDATRGRGLQIDRTGQRVVLENYRDTPAPPLVVLGPTLGKLGVIDGQFTASVVDPSGTRVYAMSRESISGVDVCTLRAFDISTAPPAPSDSFPEITAGGYPLSIECVHGTDEVPSVVLAEDGRTIFSAGRQGVEVIPLP